MASIDDIDAAIAYGPGLRWAIIGPQMLYHLAGGQGGLRHLLEHIGPGIETWWNDLGRPDLTPDVVDCLVEAFDASNPRTIQDLAAERDALLIGLLESLAETRRALAARKETETHEGLDEKGYSHYFAALALYYVELRTIDERHPLPEPMPFEEFARFLGEATKRYT